MSKKMMQLKVARRRKNSPLEEFHSYMCCKLSTCQRFQFCSSSVVCTTLTWEQLALCCSGTIALWRVGTSPVLWWVNTAGTAFCVCTHECACVPIHSTHILYSSLIHLHHIVYTCTQILPLTILIQFTLRPPTHIISHKSHTHTHTHTHAHLHTHTHAHTHTHRHDTHTHTPTANTHATQIVWYCLSSCTCRLSV